MPQNRVLFQIGTDPWTLAAVCLVLSGCLIVIAAVLFVLLVVRRGRTRRLTGREASRVAFNADKLGAELRTIHGPAKGVEARVSFSIGDLRRARRAGDSLVFWGAPAMLMAWSGAFGLLCFAGALWTRDIVLLAGLAVVIPIFLIACFMPWAAIHTELE